jgi:SAM-dependent methyltransferase
LGEAVTSTAKPNAQFNLARPDSLVAKTAQRSRYYMFDVFILAFKPRPHETVLDVGVTSDQAYEASNYFENLYPLKDKVTAAGLDDASFLESRYPGMKFVKCDALEMPFADQSFDLVHSSAVIEHVGSRANQALMIGECARVARRGICLTTPNRWFPIEVHTQLPFLHWLPPVWHRQLFRNLGYGFFAEESNLNLLSARDLRQIAAQFPGWTFHIEHIRLFGLISNLMLFGFRDAWQATA